MEDTTSRGVLRHGLSVLVQSSPLVRLLVANSIINCALGMSAAIESGFMVTELGADGFALGAVVAVGSVGGVASGLLAARLSRRLGLQNVLAFSIVVSAPFSLLLPAATSGPGIALIAIGNFLVTAGLTFFAVAAISFRQLTVSSRDLAATLSVFQFFGGLTSLLGAALAIVSSLMLPPRGVLVAAAIMLFAGSLPLIGFRRLSWAASASESEVADGDGTVLKAG